MQAARQRQDQPIDLAAITIRDVHEALGAPQPIAIEAAVDHPDCPVEHAVVMELGAIFRTTEAFMLQQMQDVTLAAIAGRLRL